MRRLPHLDAVRGIAALVVVAHHAWLALPAPRWQGNPLADLVVLGRPAVILFFVLSGYVLTLCWQAAPGSMARFALRRLLRILPPYWAAIVVATLLFLASPRRPLAGLSPWHGERWHQPILPTDLARHLLLLAGPRQFPLDHVAWSLVHELRFSLVILFMVLLSRRCGSIGLLAVAAAATLLANAVVAAAPALFATGVHGFLFDAQGLGPSFVLTARFALAFAIGIAAASRAGAIASACERWPSIGPVAMVASVLLLSRGSECAMTMGAALLVAVPAASPRLERALAGSMWVWLGRVSYSLYLLHLPIMLACAAWLDGLLPPLATLAVTIAGSLVAADLFFRFVERPSIRLSRLVGVTGPSVAVRAVTEMGARRQAASVLAGDRGGVAPMPPDRERRKRPP